MPNATLVVLTVTTDDVGQYECQAINLMGSSVANVLVSYRGEAGVLPSGVWVCHGDHVSPCERVHGECILPVCVCVCVCALARVCLHILGLG